MSNCDPRDWYILIWAYRKSAATEVSVGERVSAKKLVVSTYLQYVLIALGALLLFAFVRQLGVVPIVAIIAAASRYLRETLLLERWRKAPVTEIVFEEGQPEAVATGEEPASLRCSAEGKG